MSGFHPLRTLQFPLSYRLEPMPGVLPLFLNVMLRNRKIPIAVTHGHREHW
jgi:hypothetical protein